MAKESVLARLRLVKQLIRDKKLRNAEWNVDELIKEIVGDEDGKI